jgi:hypothetical protein
MTTPGNPVKDRVACRRPARRFLLVFLVGVTVFNVILAGLFQDSSPNWQPSRTGFEPPAFG